MYEPTIRPSLVTFGFRSIKTFVFAIDGKLFIFGFEFEKINNLEAEIRFWAIFQLQTL